MPECDDSYLYTSPWFYLFLLTLILFFIFIIVIENDSNFKNGTSTPMWLWLVFVFLILFLFISFILYYYHVKNYDCFIPFIEQPLYENVPIHLSAEPCSIPVGNGPLEHYVREEIYEHYDEHIDKNITIYKYTDADVNIPFNALNPYI